VKQSRAFNFNGLLRAKNALAMTAAVISTGSMTDGFSVIAGMTRNPHAHWEIAHRVRNDVSFPLFPQFITKNY
jgi:hypothetical protein